MHFISIRTIAFGILTLISGCGLSPVASSHALIKAMSAECWSGALSEVGQPELRINHYLLNANERRNLAWIKKCVLPVLPGAESEKLKILSEVVWWSLREGVLEQSGPSLFAYSNCHFRKTGDRLISTHPLQDCETNTWQVGIMAGQAMNYSVQQIKEKISELTAEHAEGLSEDGLLEWTANLAGFIPGSPASQQILNSQGRVRRGWLVRNPLIATLLVKEEVESECFEQRKPWCFQGAYEEAVKFSGSRDRMISSIQDLQVFFNSAN